MTTPSAAPARGDAGLAERRTSDVASILGVPVDALRKWKARGLLPLAPCGVQGQGRGVECFWSDAAIAEAKVVRDTRKRGHARTRFRSTLAQGRADGGAS